MASVSCFGLRCGRSLLLACAATAPLLSLVPMPALAHSPRWRHERHWHPGRWKAERRWSRAQHWREHHSERWHRPNLKGQKRWSRSHRAPADQVRESPFNAPQPRRQARSTPERCNTGRLLGGLSGGAAAYALSRQDSRAWAIPLGALLGSQMGCSVATGRGPVPW